MMRANRRADRSLGMILALSAVVQLGLTVPVMAQVAPTSASLGLPFDAQRGVFSFAAGLDASLPAVVQVTTLGQSRGPVSDNNPKPSQGGSGVIIDAAKGLVVTNHHVIENGQKYTVDLLDGRLFDAILIGADKATDIAVLKIEGTGLSQVEVVDSDTLRTGDLAFAVGYPMGLDQTLTMGVISGLNRSGVGDAVEDYIQTDAAVNHGNSGGPLLDSRGRLIGINTAILSGGLGGGNDGIAFAVPTRIMNFVVGQLLMNGEVRRGQIGAALGSLTAERARERGLNLVRGAIVYDAIPGSAAEQAGLRPGDIIVTLQGRPVSSEGSVLAAVGISSPGTQLPITYLRDAQTLSTTLVVQEPHPGGARLGTDAVMVRGVTARRVGAGLEIRVVEPGTQAERAGVVAGDVITSVQGRRVSTVQDLARAFDPDTQSRRIQVQRDGRSVELTLEP